MRAAVLEGVRRLVARPLPEPEPADGELRVRVTRAGVCGSDVHVWATGAFGPRYPVVPGHEVVGVVDGVGAGVAGFALGDRVVLDSRVPCGRCAQCAAGHLQRCREIGFLGEVRDGGFAELVCTPAARSWRLPGGLDDRVGVLAEPTAVAVHAWRRLCDVAGPPERVVVLGGGAIGVLLALVIGDEAAVELVEPDAWRRDRAAAITGRPVTASAPGRPAPAVVDCAGFAGSLAAAAGYAEPGGTIVCVALHHASESVDLNQLVADEQVVLGAHVFDEEMPLVLELLERRSERFAPVVSDPIGLDDLPARVAEAAEGHGRWTKLTVDPRLPG